MQWLQVDTSGVTWAVEILWKARLVGPSLAAIRASNRVRPGSLTAA